MDEHLGPVSCPPMGSWPGLQMQAYVSPREGSLKSDQKADRYPPPPQHHCTCLAVLVIVGVQMLGGTIDGFPPSSLHQTSWSRESQPAKRKNQLGFSVIQVCSIFRKQDLTITFWRMTKINSLCCFRVLPGYSWLEKQQKQKNLREISHTCHWGFCKPKVSGTRVVLCVGQP